MRLIVRLHEPWPKKCPVNGNDSCCHSREKFLLITATGLPLKGTERRNVFSEKTNREIAQTPKCAEPKPNIKLMPNNWPNRRFQGQIGNPEQENGRPKLNRPTLNKIPRLSYTGTVVSPNRNVNRTFAECKVHPELTLFTHPTIPRENHTNRYHEEVVYFVAKATLRTLGDHMLLLEWTGNSGHWTEEAGRNQAKQNGSIKTQSQFFLNNKVLVYIYIASYRVTQTISFTKSVKHEQKSLLNV